MARNADKHRIREQLQVWLPTVMIESLLIVVSILLALWLDGRQDDLEAQEVVDLSIVNFERELKQNRNLIADIFPYHAGLQSVLHEMSSDQSADRLSSLHNILDGLQMGVLFSSAWETAVATGALTRMDFDLVSALSRTYSLQRRFENDYATKVSNLADRLYLDTQSIESKIFVATKFIDEMTNAESELDIYYQQVLGLIEEYKAEHELLVELDETPAMTQ